MNKHRHLLMRGQILALAREVYYMNLDEFIQDIEGNTEEDLQEIGLLAKALIPFKQEIKRQEEVSGNDTTT